MKNSYRFFWVDAFTDQPFRGNPAVVCLIAQDIPVSAMQNLAAEFGVSETVFVTPSGKDYSLRWFTPRMEVKLCGHATLAAAWVLWKEKLVDENEIFFHTCSGRIKVCRSENVVTLEFPVVPVYHEDIPPQIIRALRVQPQYTAKAGDDWLIELTSEQEVIDAKPDFISLESVWPNGVIITAAGSEKADFVSRYFAPGEGISEDPVTGSAHCALGYYWSEKLDKKNLYARQLSFRGGQLQVRVSSRKVYISGEAFILCSGTIMEPD